jgi:hypothetical protein
VEAVCQDLAEQDFECILERGGLSGSGRPIGHDALDDRVQKVILRADVLVHEGVRDAGFPGHVPNCDSSGVPVGEELFGGVENPLGGLLA